VKRDRLERSPKLYLSEIIEFIERIKEYTEGITYEDFLKNRQAIDAVDANVRKIGEAVRVLSKNGRIRNLFYRYHIPYQKTRWHANRPHPRILCRKHQSPMDHCYP
jgi:uncharacterized protein with HEPN domain